MITFSLPYPPSVNHYCGQHGKRRFMRPAGRKFLADSQAILFANRIPKQTGRVMVTLIPHPPDRRIRDADNTAKVCLDFLVKNGVIIDDSSRYLRRLVIEWGDVVPGGRMDVMIEPYKSHLAQIQKSFLNN